MVQKTGEICSQQPQRRVTYAVCGVFPAGDLEHGHIVVTGFFQSAAGALEVQEQEQATQAGSHDHGEQRHCDPELRAARFWGLRGRSCNWT